MAAEADVTDERGVAPDDAAGATPGGDAVGRRAPAMDPDRLAELEEERRFLLRSLADLEREREAGDVDEADYEALRDGYTSRAAAVLRSIDAGRAQLPAKRSRNVGRIVGIAAGVVVVGVVLGVLVAKFASPRGSGDTITGGTDRDRIAALLSEGRSALPRSDFETAISSYRQVLDVEPDNVEARTYLGWVLVVSAQVLPDPTSVASTTATGKQTIEEAIATDPTYADSYCFLAIIAAQFDDDLATATSRRQECLDHDPSSELADLVDELVTPFVTPTSDADVSGTTGSTG